MSPGAETLRRAAALMLEEHGPEHQRHDVWSAMAHWLDAEAAKQTPLLPVDPRALAVAVAYLGGTP